MKNKTIFLMLMICTATIIADNPLAITLKEGKNNFTILQEFPARYASDIIEENSNIQSITMYQYEQTFAYINIMGGIGTNFPIENNINYEIYTNASTIIYLKP
jgi:hypothetical protein